jgi:hypothetical protein
MAIILQDPIVRVNGVAVPYFSWDNGFFTRLKTNLRDENIYDTSKAAVPFTDKIVTFLGTATPGQALRCYNEYLGQKRLVANLTANASGGFEASVRLRNGLNRIVIETPDGTDVSNSVFMNAYRLHTWLVAYAEELDSIRSESAQIRQDSKLRTSIDFDGNAILNTGRGLTESFGQFVKPLYRLPYFTTEDWRLAIRDIFAAYEVAPSHEAMRRVVRFFTLSDPEFRFYRDENRLRRPRFTDANMFLASAGNPGADRTFQWQARRIPLYNRWWTTLASSVTLPASSWSYIYFDGLTQASGQWLPGEVKSTSFLWPTVTTTSPIVTGTRPITETILSGDILYDDAGKKTGLSGELYVRVSYPISGLNGVSGTGFAGTISTATRVPGTNFIDLGQAQLGQNKRTVLGDILVSYRTPVQIFEVAQVGTSATTVTGMITGLRFDEVSGVIREEQVAQHAGELWVYNSQTLSSGERNILTGVLVDMKLPESFFYVFMQDPLTGELRFQAKV